MEKICPLVKEACWEHKCKFYTHLQGRHPQSGAQMDSWDCSLSFIPILLVNLGKETSEVGAAVESLRNETSANTVQRIAETAKLLGANS